MEELLNQIERAVKAKLYFLALMGVLIIPDICGAIESTDGEASRDKYIKWFDKNLEPEYGECFTGADCYYFRCSLLHQGSTRHSNSRYSRILFIEPGPRPLYHANIMNDAFNIDVEIFCHDIIRKARQWLVTAKQMPNFQQNIDKFMQRYPNGLPPYITGFPVIS